MITQKNMLPVMAVVAIAGMLLIIFFSMKQSAQKSFEESTTVQAIENDLKATGLENLDKETAQIKDLLN